MSKALYFVNANFVENFTYDGKDQSDIDFEKENVHGEKWLLSRD